MQLGYPIQDTNGLSSSRRSTNTCLLCISVINEIIFPLLVLKMWAMRWGYAKVSQTKEGLWLVPTRHRTGRVFE